MTASSVDPLRRLAAPLEQLLASGGDTRLNLDPATQLNGYGCRSFPRSEAFTFASSTATSISDRAYAAAAGARQALLRDSRAIGFDHAFEMQMDLLRAEFEQLLGLAGSGCGIVFSPSGTDSQLHAVAIARAVLGAPLVNVIAAADETGSGTAFVARGRHFNDVTAQGVAVVKGEPILGLADGVESVAVPMRDVRGALRPDGEIDRDIADALLCAVAAGKHALLFAMDRSKLGLRAPSFDALRWIAREAGEQVHIVIDACQARLGRKRLHWYLDQGFMVLLTGSKFFTGAPFSGALILPPALATRCRALDGLGAGLADYTSREDWSPTLPRLRAAMPLRANIGQFLRWTSALAEMRDYFAAPIAFRELALAQFARSVPRLIDSEACLEPLRFDDEATDDIDDEEMGVRTIFPFFVRRGTGKLLSLAQATMLYRALNDDVAFLLPANLPAMQRLLATRRCHIGQPVAVPDGSGNLAGALRVSVGARVVSETWCGDMLISRENLRGEFDQIRAILEKIRLLVRYFDAIEPTYEQPRTYLPCQVSAA